MFDWNSVKCDGIPSKFLRNSVQISTGIPIEFPLNGSADGRNGIPVERLGRTDKRFVRSDLHNFRPLKKFFPQKDIFISKTINMFFVHKL